MLYYLLEDNMKRYAWHQTYLHSLREEMRKKHVAIKDTGLADSDYLLRFSVVYILNII